MSNPLTNQSPLHELWQDKKFRLALLDAIGSTILLLATRFLSPADVDLIKQLLVILQPVVIMVGVGISVETNARIAAQARIDEAVITAKTLAATTEAARLAASIATHPPESESAPNRSRKG